jgi:hypothetical protein
MAAGPSPAPNLHSLRWPEVLARLDYLARYAPPSSPWRDKFLTTFRRSGASKERWVPVIESMREAGVLTEDEEFFCKVVLALEAARDVQDVEDDKVVRLEDLFHLYGGERMANLYRNDRAEFAKRYQRGAQVTARL